MLDKYSGEFTWKLVTLVPFDVFSDTNTII